MTTRKTSPHISLVLPKKTLKLRKNVRHFSTSICRGVRGAHFKSALYLGGAGFAILGLIIWLLQ
jgi:hypothetical protein